MKDIKADLSAAQSAYDLDGMCKIHVQGAQAAYMVLRNLTLCEQTAFRSSKNIKLGICRLPTVPERDNVHQDILLCGF